MAKVEDLYDSVSLKQAYEECRKADDTKDVLVGKMISKISTLEAVVAHDSDELEQKSKLVAVYLKENKGLKAELRILRKDQDKENFVLVLVDGDIMLFHDEYVQKGETGGSNAARELRTAVQQYLDTVDLSCKIMVNVFANFSGLRKIYGLPVMDSFIKGFNMFDGLYHITEAGNGKECADEKIKKAFEIFVRNAHCKRIFFGGSGDNGYARLLRPFVDEKKIVLLEGPPFARELANLEPHFEKTSFKKVFRSTKIETAIPAATNPLSLLSNPAEEKISTIVASPRSPPTWTAVVSTSLPLQTDKSIQTSRQCVQPFENGFKIYRNINGERIDEPLNVFQTDIQRIKLRKFCNAYHLFNNCEAEMTGETCVHTHGARLVEREFLAQRALARKLPCDQRLNCSDPWCSFGHQCPNGKACLHQKCWFSEEVHDVDTNIVKTDQT